MEWKDIIGFEGYYQVSSEGYIRSVDRYVQNSNGSTRLLKGKMMKLSEAVGRANSDGYYVVNLHKNCKSYVMHVHRIVANAFIPNPNNYPTVNHKDGNKHNNSVDNLEWVTYLENNSHALQCGLRKPRGTKVIQMDINGNVIAEYHSVCEASRATGIGRSIISHCVNNRVSLAGGYAWIKKFEKYNDYLHKESTSEDELPMEVQEP